MDHQFQQPFYIDANPHEHSELISVYGYPTTEGTDDFGGGTVNRIRSYNFSYAGTDLFTPDWMTIVMHEIGHALGMSSFHDPFLDAQEDGYVTITSPRPNAGSVLPLDSESAHFPSDGLQPSPLMTPGNLQHMRQRVYPSTQDILAIAEFSQFVDVNLNYEPIPAGVDRKPGDFDRDGTVNADDIDALRQIIRDGLDGDIYKFNLTGADNLVNQNDVDNLIWNVLESEYGDINLNGIVTHDDFEILQDNFGMMSGAGWADGDVDGNGAINLVDFNILKANCQDCEE